MTIPGIILFCSAMNSSAFKVPVHVEIAVKASCLLRTDGIISVVSDWIRRKCAIFQNGNIAVDNEIAHIADSISVADLAPGKCISFWQAELCLHPYRLSTQGPENDFMEGEEELPAAEQWELPNALLNNLWGSIVIDSVLKTRLLSYCSSSIRFSEAKIDTDIISWNRMILLHGPPGKPEALSVSFLNINRSSHSFFFCIFSNTQERGKRQFARD